jgi:surface antigen
MKAGENILPAGMSRVKSWLTKSSLVGVSLLAMAGLQVQPAFAHTTHHTTTRHVVKTHVVTTHTTHTHTIVHKLTSTNSHRTTHLRSVSSSRHSKIRYAHYSRHSHSRYASAHYRHSYLQCVPYAREVSHIDLAGDAFLWWAEASGRYARGETPVEGAVLNFRSIRRMPLGHVAVVTSVIDSRTILVTQANWIPGTITNDVTVEDVSADNDWSEVQVELGDGQKMGAAYPTYGFIYNQPDNGTIIAGNNPAQPNEVAEAPSAVTVSTQALDRNLQ